MSLSLAFFKTLFMVPTTPLDNQKDWGLLCGPFPGTPART